MLQTLIVGLIVTVAALYSVWALMPALARRKAAAWLARQASRRGLAAADAERLQSALASAGSCNECSSCKGCSSPVGAAAKAAPEAWQPAGLPRRKP